MIQTSARFHEAIREGEPQFPFFLFNDGRMILPEDIDIDSGGFNFSETCMSSEDYVPGGTPSASLNFYLMNDKGAWNNYSFGEFTAWLGVRTETKDLDDTSANCRIKIGSTVIDGWNDAPYLRLNGDEVSGVEKPVRSLLLNGSSLYAFTDNSYYLIQYTGSMITVLSQQFSVNNLLADSVKWNREGRSRVYGWKWANADSNIRPENCMTEFIGNKEYHYEMIRLGVFDADRPVFASRKTLEVECFDRMKLFDVQYDSSEFTFPTTLLSFAADIATAVGVSYESSSVGFANPDMVVNSPDLKECTYRDVLKYIGELSGTYARITRDGKLKYTWFRTSGHTYSRHDYTECQVGYYTVPNVDKVIIRDYNRDDIVSGTGENAIYISNNPLAGGDS